MNRSAPPFAPAPLQLTAPSTAYTAYTLTADQLADFARALRAPTPLLLTDEQSAAVLGVSVRRFHELRHEEFMPPPVVLGPRLLRWHHAEIEAAIAKMPRQAAAAAEPAQLLRVRVERAKRTGDLS